MTLDPREQKLQTIINEGSASVTAALASIKSEFELRKDLIVRPNAIDYRVSDKRVLPVINNVAYNLTDHSRGQLYARAGIPSTYADKLMEMGETDLLHDNLHRLTQRQMSDGVLVRQIPKTQTIEMKKITDDTFEVAGTIKGWLSPAFKRMDASPIFESYIDRSLKKGFVPYRGHNTDYRYQISFIFPQVFQPMPNEFVTYGTSLITGDYGSSAMELSMMILRIVCKNLALGYDLFRRVHIGSRFHAQEDFVELSRKTIMLDSKTVASAMGDVVDHSMKQIDYMQNAIADAGKKEVDPKKIYESLKKGGIKKDTVDKIKTTFETELPTEMLPNGNSMWRMSNAISLIAGSLKNADKKIDLEKEAMNLIIN